MFGNRAGRSSGAFLHNICREINRTRPANRPGLTV